MCNWTKKLWHTIQIIKILSMQVENLHLEQVLALKNAANFLAIKTHLRRSSHTFNIILITSGIITSIECKLDKTYSACFLYFKHIKVSTFINFLSWWIYHLSLIFPNKKLGSNGSKLLIFKISQQNCCKNLQIWPI